MSTKTIEVQQTQTYLKELLSLVGTGSEVIFTQGNTPIARLVPITSSATGSRVAGLHKDSIWTSADFDEPLSDEFWLGTV